MTDPALPTCLITVLRDGTGQRLQMRLVKSLGTSQASLGDFEDLGEFDDPASAPGGTTAFLKPLWRFTALGSRSRAEQISAVRHYGERLWNQLPRDFQAFYWSDLHDKPGLSLAIWTDALHFPWEMVWPRKPRTFWPPFGRSTGIESLFGLTFSLARWPWHRDELPHDAIDPAPFTVYTPRFTAEDLAALISCFFEEFSCREALHLKKVHGANWVGPATKKRVVETIKQGAGALHIRTHGGNGEDGGWIELDRTDDPEAEDETTGHPFYLEAWEVANLIEADGRFMDRAFVFLNACQSGSRRAASAADGAGLSWTQTLTRAGCDAFVGHYWNVNQDPATTASARFYDRLKAGDTLGEAALAVRHETLTLTDPYTVDYLGYSLVGNPAQRFNF